MKPLKVEWETEEGDDADAILDSIFDILLPDSELCEEDVIDDERIIDNRDTSHTSKA